MKLGFIICLLQAKIQKHIFFSVFREGRGNQKLGVYLKKAVKPKPRLNINLVYRKTNTTVNIT